MVQIRDGVFQAALADLAIVAAIFIHVVGLHDAHRADIVVERDFLVTRLEERTRRASRSRCAFIGRFELFLLGLDPFFLLESRVRQNRERERSIHSREMSDRTNIKEIVKRA